MQRRILNWMAAGLVLAMGCIPALAQGQITLGTSLTELNFTGNGSGTTTISVSERTGGNFGCGSASGSGSLAFSNGSFLISNLATANPILTLQATGNGNFTVVENAAITVAIGSNSPGLLCESGNNLLTGSLTLENITMVNSNTAIGTGALVVPSVGGGTFASAFASGAGTVSLTFALGGNLQTVVGTSSTMTGQVEFPSTISTPPTCDFLTGGGWIPNTSATGTGSLAASPGGGNGKATFAIEGGCKHCEGWGHLTYIDHATGMHFQGKADPSCPIAYSFVSNGPPSNGGQPTGCRRMRGEGTVNGQPGYSYDVTACDNGEPGTSDTFDVTLSGGGATYHNSGTLGGGTQGGGNIQLHKGNQSFCCSTQ